jgi:hypothetical protein
MQRSRTLKNKRENIKERVTSLKTKVPETTCEKFLSEQSVALYGGW